ncbi:MAG: HAD-IA family hydrolase [Hyphomicrobiaceae bacterium]
MKLVLFDCDGTIVDSQHAISAAMEIAFAEHGLVPPERSRIIEVVGLSLLTAVRELIPDGAHDVVYRVSETYKDAFSSLRRQAAHEEPLFPLARETIMSIAQVPGIMLGLATGKSRRGVDAVIERENLHGIFETIQTADDNPSKPHPGMVLKAMNETGRLPDQTLVVGDTTFDMEMARSARAKAVGVTWGYHPRAALTKAGADALIESYAELPGTIDRLLTPVQPAA